MIQLVRLSAVAYVGFLSFIFAFLLSHWLDKITSNLDKTKTKWRTFIEVAFQFALIGALIYLSRGLIKKIPFPLDGVSGYNHKTLGELKALPLIVFIVMFFQERTQDKMKFLISSQSVIPTKFSST